MYCSRWYLACVLSRDCIDAAPFSPSHEQIEPCRMNVCQLFSNECICLACFLLLFSPSKSPQYCLCIIARCQHSAFFVTPFRCPAKNMSKQKASFGVGEMMHLTGHYACMNPGECPGPLTSVLWWQHGQVPGQDMLQISVFMVPRQWRVLQCQWSPS